MRSKSLRSMSVNDSLLEFLALTPIPAVGEAAAVQVASRRVQADCEYARTSGNKIAASDARKMVLLDTLRDRAIGYLLLGAIIDYWQLPLY